MLYENTYQLGHIARYNGLLISCSSTEQLTHIITDFFKHYALAGVVKIFSTSFTQSINITQPISCEKIKYLLNTSDKNLSVQTIDDYLLIKSDLVILVLQCRTELLDTLQDNITFFIDALNFWLKRNDINTAINQSVKQLTQTLSYSMEEVGDLTEQLTTKGNTLISNTLSLSFDQLTLLDIDDFTEDKLKELIENCSHVFSDFLSEVNNFTHNLNDNLVATQQQLNQQQLVSDNLQQALASNDDIYQDVLF